MTQREEWGFTPGLVLSATLFEEGVRPVLSTHYPELSYAFARLAHGSDVFGFDSSVSMDHGWGPRGTLFLPEPDFDARASEISELLAQMLPLEVAGVPTNLDSTDPHVAAPKPTSSRPIRHGVSFETIPRFFHNHLGFDPLDGVELSDWLSTPSQRLATLAEGRVFHDSLGGLEQRRGLVRWYPQDVWAYLMACQWRRVGQEEAFIARAGHVGDELGSRILASRMCGELMRLAFLQERRHAPYAKWFGSAFGRLDCSSVLAPVLMQVLSDSEWRTRERHLGLAYQILAERHNRLGLGPRQSAVLRPYRGRPYQVIEANRFAEALEAAITDLAVAELPRGLGAVWQLSDSTDLLEDVQACRKLGRQLCNNSRAAEPTS